MRHIAIFQASWPLQVHTVNSVITLANAGFEVDLFLCNVNSNYTEAVFNDERIRVYKLPGSEPADIKPSVQKCGSDFALKGYVRSGIRSNLPRLYAALRSAKSTLMNLFELALIYSGSEKGLLPATLIEDTVKAMEGKNYIALIGIEKRGLVWAGKVSTILPIPYLYHSLELYLKNDPEFADSVHARRLKIAEEKYHKGCCATIIQDSKRAEILFRDNEISDGKALFVPVSLLGEPIKSRSMYFQDKFNLPEDTVLVLHFGQIWEKRFSFELARLAQSFPEKWKMVFHGPEVGSDGEKVRQIDQNGNVVMSTDLIPYESVPALVTSAHIGLVLYQSSRPNDYYAAFSSEKIALYLQCGLPIIAFNYPGYEHIEKCRCGVLIDSIEDIKQAVEKIMQSYEEYRSNAHKCFTTYYEFSKNYQSVIDAMEKIK